MPQFTGSVHQGEVQVKVSATAQLAALIQVRKTRFEQDFQNC